MKKTALSLCIFISVSFIGNAQSLAELLGYKKYDKILIINNDDAGMCHASNVGTIQGMKEGLISSTTIMTPCPWFNEIALFAKNNPELSFGVHLTLTSEWEHYRWGTVAPRDQVSKLYDKQGYMWHTVADVYASSMIEEALIEGRAQINKALDSGIPITHIDSHMGTYQYSADYLNIYLQLAEEFNLPLRMASQNTLDLMGVPDFRQRCREKGLICPDYFIYEEFENYTSENVEQFWTDYLKNLKPGVTEIFVHASADSDEIRSITHSAETRVKELAFFTSDAAKELIHKEGITVIGYRELLNLQRKLKK
ncbi:polysaccharide deacetylase family protein [Proteiniphilum sp.]|uniref:polysaccharide deacetylase family protein n=1 Tax=Proteiniphilum sp. TaxID=1926877 RepID=UPI00332B755A